MKADERLAAKLALNPNDKVWHVKRVRFIREKPVNLEETWMPLAMFPDLTEVMEQSKYHYIEQIKRWLSIAASRSWCQSCHRTRRLPPGARSGKTDSGKVSRGFLKDGRVFEYSRNVFNSDDYKFTLVAKRRQ